MACSENSDLPVFVVLLSGENNPDGGKSCWGSGFLPTMHQGVEFRSNGETVLFVSDPEGVDADARGRSIGAINDLNRIHAAKVGDPEIQTRISAYELAYRMQTSVPELTDVSRSRRRFTSCTARSRERRRSRTTACSPVGSWSAASVSSSCITAVGHHGASFGEDIVEELPHLCRETDRPVYGLLTTSNSAACWRHARRLGRRVRADADERGAQRLELPRPGSHRRAYTMWLAGGGMKPGLTIGSTDDLGYNVVETPSMYTTSRPPCCGCWGSITRS